MNYKAFPILDVNGQVTHYVNAFHILCVDIEHSSKPYVSIHVGFNKSGSHYQGSALSQEQRDLLSSLNLVNLKLQYCEVYINPEEITILTPTYQTMHFPDMIMIDHILIGTKYNTHINLACSQEEFNKAIALSDTKFYKKVLNKVKQLFNSLKG